MKRLTMLAAVLTLVFGVSAFAQGLGFEANPDRLDFGSVTVGESRTMTVTVTSLSGSHQISAAAVYEGAPDFYLVLYDTRLMQEGESADVVIGFAPDAEGDYTGTGEVIVINLGSHLVEIPLTGSGVGAAPDPLDEIQEIVDFFDAAMTQGCLAGDGPGSSGAHRWKALRNTLLAASDAIADGRDLDGCTGLLEASERTDGLPRPPDFVADGEACDDPDFENASTQLWQKVVDLMVLLGC